jgi:multidrug efflux system membrane fusion protein
MVERGLVTDASVAKKSQFGWVKIVVYVLVIALAVFVVMRIVSSKKQESQKAAAAQTALSNRPVNVQAVPVATRPMPIFLSSLGTVTPYYTVTLKARVNGPIVSVRFKEGQEVKQGEVLLVVDPAPYKAALDQAKGTLAHDEALLKNAMAEFNRYKALYGEGVISKESLDSQESNYGQYKGAIEADKATIENAQIQLDWCTVRAPITGRVGLRLVDPGNVITANTTNLVVINQFKPIAVDFTLPETQLETVLASSKDRKGMKVEAWDRDEEKKIADGVLLTADNQIDTTTGTVKLKAVFDNKDESLFPNEFVNIHLIQEIRQNAIVMPSAAVQTGTQGNFVWVVAADKSAEMRSIDIAITEGQTTIVDEGVKPGEQVVVDGADKIKPGTKLDVKLGGAGGKKNKGASAANSNAAQAAPAAAAVGKGSDKKQGHHKKDGN